MKRINTYSKKIAPLDGEAVFEFHEGYQIIDIESGCGNMTIRVIEDPDTPIVCRIYHLWGCNVVPNDVTGYTFIKTIRRHSSVQYLFQKD
jgi:hypothetical protein